MIRSILEWANQITRKPFARWTYQSKIRLQKRQKCNGSPEIQEKTKKYLADCKKGLIRPICVPWDKEEYLVKRSGPFSSSEERVFSYPKISPKI